MGPECGCLAHHPIQPYQVKSVFSDETELLIPTPKRRVVMFAVRRCFKELSKISYRSEDSDLHMWVIKSVRSKTVELADIILTASTLFSPEALWLPVDARLLQQPKSLLPCHCLLYNRLLCIIITCVSSPKLPADLRVSLSSSLLYWAQKNMPSKHLENKFVNIDWTYLTLFP